MKRQHPRTFVSSDRSSTRVRRSNTASARRNGTLKTWQKHPFFDALPEDALILVVRRLSTTSSQSPQDCPLLNLAPVSEYLRRIIATSVGTRLAFSVYGNPDWFWRWISVARGHVRHLSLHNRPFRAAGEVQHQWPMWPMWPMWPKRPGIKLDAFSTLRAVLHTGAPLVELDISGFALFRRTSIAQLEELLTCLRPSLTKFKFDMSHLRVATAVVNARLTGLTTMTIARLREEREEEVLPVFRSMEGEEGQGCGLSELMLDQCINMPTIFGKHGTELARLLPNLQLFHIDYDDELHYFSTYSTDFLGNLCAIATLTTLKSIRFSGSGLPVTPDVITELRARCTNLTEFRLIDCDVAPEYKPHASNPDIVCNEALTCTGSLLTHYYPRWVTFRLEQLDTLAMHCKRLSHLRVFTAPGAEEALLELGDTLRNSLVDLEVYPKIHEKRREMASTVVKMVQSLTKLERLSLVTLDLSCEQLKCVLKHCGANLKFFSFSPPLMSDKDDDEKGKCIVDIIVAAAKHNAGLQRFECIFQDYTVPVVTSKIIAHKLTVAVRLLESRATRLESGSIVRLVNNMTDIDTSRRVNDIWTC